MHKFLSQVAQTPPMGWNSFDCFGSDVTEAEIRANAEYMAKHLKQYGWDTIVVDFCWSHPTPGACQNPHQADGFQPLLDQDRWGRLTPSVNRFPSAANGAGFKPLADYIHSLGLKFGIHVMRGIPRQVVHDDMKLLNNPYRAMEIADTKRTCTWLNHMYGVNTDHPGGQLYYNSVFELYASWDVDYVKVDDILADGNFDSTGPYHAGEVEAIAKAIDHCGRPMVLSLSPGDALFTSGPHLEQHASAWRISADFWDDWRRLKRAFDLCRKWNCYRSPGHWPDADMLPIGRISKRGPKGPERDSWFTQDEHYTLITLWSIFQSPLMIGGNLPELDTFTKNLLSNDEVLAVNQHGTGAYELTREGDLITWISRDKRNGATYLALFNIGEEKRTATIAPAAYGLPAGAARDLWKKAAEPINAGKLSREIASHGCALFKLTA